VLQESELRLVKDASNLLENLAEKRNLPELAIVVLPKQQDRRGDGTSHEKH